MRQYKLNEVFEDSKNFSEPKRLKVIPFVDYENNCKKCAYYKTPQSVCDKIKCWMQDVYFIETTEPLTPEL